MDLTSMELTAGKNIKIILPMYLAGIGVRLLTPIPGHPIFKPYYFPWPSEPIPCGYAGQFYPAYWTRGFPLSAD